MFEEPPECNQEMDIEVPEEEEVSITTYTCAGCGARNVVGDHSVG